MTRKGFVIATDGKTATVMPLEKDSCSTCTTDCSKKNVTLVVNNTDNLPVKLGSTVMLQTPKKFQFLQGFVSLLFPILCSVGGFFLAKPICAIFGKTAGEGAKALCVLSLFALSSGLVFFLSRKFPMPGTPEIVEIL